MRLADRITRYLLARQRRRAIHQLYETAAGVGLLESAFVEAGTEESGLVWRLPATAPGLTGNPDHDRTVVAKALRKRPHPYIGSAAGGSVEVEGVRSVSRGRVEREAQAAAARTEASAESARYSAHAATGPVSSEPGAERGAMLRLIREHLPPPSVAETSVALLLARAASDSLASLAELLAVMKRPAPVIVIRAPAHAFEGRFGKMLDAGLIIPGRFHLVDGFGQYALNGAYRDNPNDRRMVTLSGKSVRERGADAIRGALMKAWSEDAPLVLADELPTSLPVRITAGADLVLTSPGIDPALIAELMQHCAGIAPKAALSAMSAAGLDASRLGIDDLVLAIRPGRSVRQMVEALKALEAESRKSDEDEETDDDKPMSRGRKRSQEKSSKSDSPRFEIIQPADLASTTHGEAEASSTDRHLLIEELAGYGEAKAWAMEVGQDLALWREGQLGWAEMSTRLLLSGPPGTGKTTFAKALCNTLQVPLLATSVAHWLEPGYLGDVLKLMSSAFATARQHAPSILFIDEFDNIGSRGGSDRYQDYWESLINRLLELLDGTGKSEGVVVIAATNRPEKIDPALLRSGRLERHVIIPKPDTEALAGILAHHLGGDLDHVLATWPIKPQATDMSEAVVKAGGIPLFVAETRPKTSPQSLDRGDRP